MNYSVCPEDEQRIVSVTVKRKAASAEGVPVTFDHCYSSSEINSMLARLYPFFAPNEQLAEMGVEQTLSFSTGGRKKMNCTIMSMWLLMTSLITFGMRPRPD